MPIIESSKLSLGSCSPTSKDRPSSRPAGKSITTSVPSIAVRFHTGDEELDIYPSTDDEDEGGKDEVLSRSTSATTASFTPPSSNPSPSVLSRDPSPMKEYLKVLGKRSSSVDAGTMDAGSSGSDTWRIFQEIKGKITKTVEEKFTEIKSERRSATPLFSGKSSSKPGRLRAGGNSQDNSSISDSEDISENSNKDDPKVLHTNDSISGTPTTAATVPDGEDKRSTTIEGGDEEIPSTSFDDSATRDSFDDALNIKEKKGKKSGLRYRKGGRVKMSMLHADDEDSDLEPFLEEDIESGVEVSEETKFIHGNESEDIPTMDYRIPHNRPSSGFKQTHGNLGKIVEETNLKPTTSEFFTMLWSYRNVSISIIILVSLFVLPIPTYLNGLIAGILIAMFYHFFIGMATWYLPYVGPNPPFKVPKYREMPILEIPLEDNILAVTRCGGWMNELPDTYDPDTYHINNTQSVYVRLEGSTLRMCHPKSKIPKRALWNERKLKLKFIHQRIYDIAGCEVKLLPEGITRKRRWSKKYPICIMLKKTAKQQDDVLRSPSSDTGLNISREASTHTLDEESLFTGSACTADVLLSPSLEEINSDTSLMKRDEDGSNSTMCLFLLDKVLPENYEVDEVDKIIASHEIMEDSFCVIDKPLVAETCLYLFSRTDREKEDWYRRFVVAINYIPPEDDEEEDGLKVQRPRLASEQVGIFVKRDHRRQYKFEAPNFDDGFIAPSALHDVDLDYVAFMNKFHLQYTRKKSEAKVAAALKLDREVDCDVMWVNALVGRILYDIQQNQTITEKISEKIQKKLGTIKLPYFVEELTLTNVDFGRDVPMIHRASRPVLDDHGLWVDLDVTFEGRIVLTVETKLNLMKLKKDALPTAIVLEPNGEETPTEDEGTPEKTSEKCKSPIYNSSVEDSAESSPTETEEEHRQSSSDETHVPSSNTVLEASADGPILGEKKKTNTGGKGVVKMMNKFVSSQFFQNATQNKYIKRAMEGVSNTAIVLAVEIKACTGQLAVNIPPPPSDRLWYGFRGNPKLWISVKPKFGHRQVNISYITSWLEKKLIQEFQKKMVLPNMDDLVISPMRTLLPE